MNGLRGGLSLGTNGTAANSVTRATTALNSWSSYLAGGASFSLYNPTIESTVANGAADLFLLSPGSGAGSHLGTFSVKAGGNVLFVTPSQYADFTGTTGAFATGGTIQLGASQVVVASAAARTATVTVTRTGGLAAASVSIASAASSPVSAVAGTDYTALAATTLNFAVGETSKTVTIALGAAPATTKKFLVNISSATGATLGAQTSTTVRLQGATADTTSPTLTIVKPVASSNNDELVGIKTLEISGGVVEANLESVTFSINGGAAVNAPITTTMGNKTWKLVINAANLATAGAALQPGVNSVTATATDLDGNITTTTARSFNYIVKRVLTVAPAGTGAGALTFSPSLSAGSLAIVGQSYSVTAAPDATSFFSSWSSSGSPAISFSTTTARTTTFTFAAGQTLIPTYLTTPFTTNVVGLYNGIVKGSTDTQANAGLFTATVTLNTGAFTGKLIVDGVTAPVAGVFNNVSKTFTSPTVANGSVYSLTINDSATPRTITGTITQYKRSVAGAVLNVTAIQGNTSFTGGPFVVAFSAPASPAPDLIAGEYPTGNGVASITIGTKGVATVKGTLADGTAFTSASTVTATNNVIPVFASFASRTGSIVGEATISGATVTGTGFRWFRSENLAAQYYPYGYANGATTGLTIDIAAGSSVLGSSLPASATFSGGEFAAASQTVNVGATSTAAAAKMVITAGINKGEWAGNATYPGKHIIGGANVNGVNYGYILSPLPAHTDGSGQGSLVVFP